MRTVFCDLEAERHHLVDQNGCLGAVDEYEYDIPSESVQRLIQNDPAPYNKRISQHVS